MGLVEDLARRRTGRSAQSPYVGDGADGARRSAQIDRDELATLDRHDPRRAHVAASAAAWDRVADDLELKAGD